MIKSQFARLTEVEHGFLLLLQIEAAKSAVEISLGKRGVMTEGCGEIIHGNGIILLEGSHGSQVI